MKSKFNFKEFSGKSKNSFKLLIFLYLERFITFILVGPYFFFNHLFFYCPESYFFLIITQKKILKVICGHTVYDRVILGVLILFNTIKKKHCTLSYYFYFNYYFLINKQIKCL